MASGKTERTHRPRYGRLSPMSRVAARIAAIAESATLAVDAKAKALKAAGRPVIGFGAGEPDFPTPAYVVEAAAAATKVVANHRYTPAAGLPEMRQQSLIKLSAIPITRSQLIKFLLPTVASKRSIKHLQQLLIQAMKFYFHLLTGLRILNVFSWLAALRLKFSLMRLRTIW